MDFRITIHLVGKEPGVKKVAWNILKAVLDLERKHENNPDVTYIDTNATTLLKQHGFFRRETKNEVIPME